jgi:hypothetical protein
MINIESTYVGCHSRFWALTTPESTSILLYPHLLASSILIFLASAMHPSGQHSPILFLVFLLLFCCGISH